MEMIVLMLVLILIGIDLEKFYLRKCLRIESEVRIKFNWALNEDLQYDQNADWYNGEYQLEWNLSRWFNCNLK